MARDPHGRKPGRASPGNPLRVLRYGTLLVLVLLAAGVLYVLAERSRAPAGTPVSSPETGEGVAQRARRLDVTRTRKGLPSLKVSAEEAVTYREGRTELHDVAVTVFGDAGEKTRISAPLAISRERSTGSWSFRDGVVLESESGVRVEMPEISYRDTPQELSTDGQVLFSTEHLEGRARGLRYLVAHRRLHFLADVELTSAPEGGGLRSLRSESAVLDPRSEIVTFNRYRAEGAGGEKLSGTSLTLHVEETGEGRRIQSLDSASGFRAELPGIQALEESAPRPGRVLTGEDLSLQLDPGGMIREAVATGGVRLSEGDPNDNPRSLSCDRLTARFGSGRIEGLMAEGSAHLRIPPERDSMGETATISAGRMFAIFDPATGEMSGLKADTDVTASHGERTLHAPRLAYDIPLERWTLTGEGDSPARLASGEAVVSAKEMEIDRLAEVLLARGEVKTAYREAGEKGGQEGSGFEGLFGAGEGALHTLSDRLQFQLKERQARYTGNVRVWRGGGSIEAERVDYDEATGVVEAREEVVARLPVPGEGAAVATTVTVTARELRYDRTAMDALFQGGIVASASGMRIQAEQLHAQGATLGGLTRMSATGNVRLRQGTVTGEGDRLEADLKADTFTLYGEGRLATMQDQSTQQVARGAVLTYERSTGRIQVESESGGRTWITLRPRSERGEQSDPESPR